MHLIYVIIMSRTRFIQAIVECRFTLQRVRDMITSSQLNIQNEEKFQNEIGTDNPMQEFPVRSQENVC